MAIRQTFKSELRVVKRVGSLVYRASIPHEIAEQKGVKGKYLRLGVPVKGKETTETEFTAKLLEKPSRVQVPKRIIEMLNITKFPTTVRIEFLGVATKLVRASPVRKPREKPTSTPPVEKPPAEPAPAPGEETVEEEAVPKLLPTPEKSLTEISKELSSLRCEVESLRDLHEKKLAELRERGEPVPQKPARLEDSASLRTLLYRTVEKTAKEVVSKEVADYCRENVPREVEKILPNVLADLVKGQLGAVLSLGDKARIPLKEASKPPVEAETPSRPETPQQHIEEKPAPVERVVSVETPKYGVVRIETSSPPQPSMSMEPKSGVKPLPESKPEIRFERDGDCTSIFEGDKHISTVCLQKTASGVLFNCGTCSWSAIAKGQEPTFSECVHIQMVKKHLESLAARSGV